MWSKGGLIIIPTEGNISNSNKVTLNQRGAQYPLWSEGKKHGNITKAYYFLFSSIRVQQWIMVGVCKWQLAQQVKDFLNKSLEIYLRVLPTPFLSLYC